ncbi:hypothetical protein QE152_g21935 [Popillia japonica]|uniref:Secreted protein n=1 Tax=Popillia japonica TaxID=7064 RepID=A0AAW1KKC7_POPJA
MHRIIILIFMAHLTYIKCQQANATFFPLGPLVQCSFLSWEFIKCKDPEDHKGNKTARDELDSGCIKFGGARYEDVERTKVLCTALENIECYGNRTFFREGVPCIKLPWNGSFLFGSDRNCSWQTSYIRRFRCLVDC